MQTHSRRPEYQRERPTGGDRPADGAILVTGAAGFAARHLISHLRSQGDGPIFGVLRPLEQAPDFGFAVQLIEADLTNRTAAKDAIGAANPTTIYHLAAQSSVADSHANPLGTLFNNIAAQVNLLEALLALKCTARLLVVSSNEVYGRVEPHEVPTRETAELRPLNAYAVSKATQDLLGYQYCRAYQLPIVRVRPSAHTGPGQTPRFMAPAFARQIARIEAGLQPPIISVGNLQAQRDLADVRDVVRGHRLALTLGEPGEVYNLGGERAVPVQTVLDLLLAMSAVDIRVAVDPAKLRPAESPLQLSDCTKLRDRTGWRPEIPLEQTLADVLADWRARVARSGDAC